MLLWNVSQPRQIDEFCIHYEYSTSKYDAVVLEQKKLIFKASK